MSMNRVGSLQGGEFPSQSFAASLVAPHSITDFDLFLKVGGIEVLYAPSPYQWKPGEISRLRAEGHEKLYYRGDESTKVEVYLSIHGLKNINQNLAPQKRILQIADLAAEFTRVLFNQKLTETAVRRAVSIVDAMRICLEEDNQCIVALTQLASQSQDSYFHSGRVAAYAIATAIQMSEKRPERLTEIGLGCLLHDIGHNQIHQDILVKEGPLNPTEFAEIHRHPELGHAQIVHAVLSIIPRKIVLHHHERQDGSGYPHQLMGGQIITEVAIAAVADVFDGLTSERPHRRARSPFQALDMMKYSMSEALNQEVFTALIESLGQKKAKKAA